MPSSFPSVDTYGDPKSVPSYIPSVNPYRAPSEQQVGALQEERRTALGKFKALEIIIASEKIKVDETAQLQELYIIKLKLNILMLETNEKKTLQRKENLTYT